MTRYFQYLVFFIVVLYCSYAHQYFFLMGMTSIKPLYWHVFTIGVAIAYIILYLPVGIKTIPKALTIWLWLFLINSILCFFYSSQSDIAEQALIESFTTVALFLSYLFIFQTDNAVSIGRFALACVVVVAVFLNVIDFLSPMWTKIPGRAAGLYVNPTIAGNMLVLATVSSIVFISKKLRVLYCVAIGVAVLITFSRGPWLFWVLAFSGLAVSNYIEIGRKGFSIVFASVAAGFIVYSALTGGVLDLVTSSGLDEYLTPGTFARLGGSGDAFSDYSTTTRVDAAIKAWDMFAENPWFGAGIGYDKEWVIGTHNTYLRLAAEGGIFRLALFIGLLVILWRKTDDIGKVTLFVYSASCLTTHTNLQSPAMLVILALVATVNYKEKHEVLQFKLSNLNNFKFSGKW